MNERMNDKKTSKETRAEKEKQTNGNMEYKWPFNDNGANNPNERTDFLDYFEFKKRSIKLSCWPRVPVCVCVCVCVCVWT